MGFSKSKGTSSQVSQNTSQSSNQAYPFLQSALGGQIGNVAKGSDILASLLGINGGDAGANAFNQFKDSSGYNFIRNEGVNGITSNKAAKGLLNSGAALKDITSYSSNLSNNFLNNYLTSLLGLSNTGIQAGQILSNAGNVSTSQGTSSGTSKNSSLGANFG